MAATTDRSDSRRRGHSRSARPAALLRQRRVQLAFDGTTGEYRLAMI